MRTRFLPVVLLFITGIVWAMHPKQEVDEYEGFDLTPIERLGKELFFDTISDPPGMSCASCHDPEVGWTGPDAELNSPGAVYKGAIPERFGNRRPPSSAYATFSPKLHYNQNEVFVGGNFWDGRATGKELGNPAADQAQGPFLNPVEQNKGNEQAVCAQVGASSYAHLFKEVWGTGSLNCDQPKVSDTYDKIARSIAAYESSREVNPFSSKYDDYLQGKVELTTEEQRGLRLFNGKGRCFSCHPSGRKSDGEPALFTDFSYDNLGVPRNLHNPFYKMDQVFLEDGTPINPEGAAWIDPGLGGYLAISGVTEWEKMAQENWGKHKVPTLRNVDKRPYPHFPKTYMHNGVFQSLEEVVHFYNTRDTEKWPPPEVSQNLNTAELGNLGLTREEEKAIVTFLKTLSDGYAFPE